METIFERHVKSLILYRDHGLDPGSGLYAILAGDLYDAIRRIDVHTREILGDIGVWIMGNMPRESYGLHAKVNDWMNTKRREQANG